MIVMVRPDDNQFTTGADGSPVYIPLTQNQIAAIRVILATLAEVNYEGASPNKAEKWENQNFNSSSQNPATIQIGPASISGSEANFSGMSVYFLDIGTESQSNQNEYHNKTNSSPNGNLPTSQQPSTAAQTTNSAHSNQSASQPTNQQNSVPLAIPAPTITPDGGTFTEPVTVTLSPRLAINGEVWTCCYTTDGSNPETSASNFYEDPLLLTQSETIRVGYYDALTGVWGGNVVSARFVINCPPTIIQSAITNSTSVILPAPTITPDGGTFSGPVTVTISLFGGFVNDAYNYAYTIDGPTNETSGFKYGGPHLTVDQSETISVGYSNDKGAQSNDASATFVIK